MALFRRRWFGRARYGELIPLAIVFLVIAIILWLLGLGGILVSVFLILFVICLVAGLLL
ncbi:MAG: DUF1328 domain-containing protein [Halobacteriota archaeon]